MVETDFGLFQCRFPASAGSSEKVTFVVRPENIDLLSLHNGLETSRPNVVHGVVKARVYLGELVEYTVDLDGQAQLLVGGPPKLGIGVGSRVRAERQPQKAVAIGHSQSQLEAGRSEAASCSEDPPTPDSHRGQRLTKS